MRKLLTIQELAEWLQVSRATVYQWVHIGYVPNIKIGNSVRFSEQVIINWLEKRQRKGRSTYKIPV